MEHADINLLDCQDLLQQDCDINQIVQLIENNFSMTFAVNIICISADEMCRLNGEYRNKSKPTNVLSFHYEETDQQIVGEIYFCPDVIHEEAADANISIASHYKHLLVHAFLHLLGYDHTTPQTQDEMESIEISLLATIGVTNPYEKLD